MPLKKYFKGSGEKVMKSMKEEYGSKKGESVFYATANKMKNKPKGKNKKPRGGGNPMEGNAMPFQLGDGGRWIDDSRKMGKSFAGGKK